MSKVVGRFLCRGCGRYANGLREEQPAGWLWAFCSQSWRTLCPDCQHKDQSGCTWERDESAPKERER